MKWTKKTYIFFALQIICFVVVPCVLIWLQYGGAELTQKYKWSITGLMLFVAVFLIAKRILVTPWLKKIDGQLAQLEIAQINTVEPAAIESTKKRYRRLAVAQLAFNAILPIAILVIGIMTIKAVQDGLVHLYGVMVFSALSIGVGLLFKAGEIYSVKCEHEGKAHEE